MPQLHHVLVTAQLKPENRRRLEAALYPAQITWAHPKDAGAIDSCIQQVDGAILAADADERILSGQKLRWIHCCHAGLDKSARQEVFDRGIILTGSAGRSAPALAEHVLAFLLSLAYDMPGILNAQRAHRWCSRELSQRSAVFGKTMGIIGLGNTGRAVAKLAKGFSMEVLGWRRKNEAVSNVDRVYSADAGDDLGEMVAQCDFLVLCAGLNNGTRHLMDEKMLRRMKKTAYLINIGRGQLVEEAALIRALEEGTLAGAALDNFEVEPLPKDSPLWELPNVILTPHTTPSLPDREERALEYVLQNIAAYRRGSGFVNRLTKADIYTP